ncbi:MAG: hypothetical protein ACJ72M_07275 [Propionibacteriaceae bacterium]
MKPSELNLDIDAARTDLLDFDIRGAAELSLSQPLVQIYVQRMLVGVLVEEVGLGGLLGVEALPDELDELVHHGAGGSGDVTGEVLARGERGEHALTDGGDHDVGVGVGGGLSVCKVGGEGGEVGGVRAGNSLRPAVVADLIAWMATAPGQPVLNEVIMPPLREGGWP